MRLVDGLMLREIAGSWVVVPVGERVVQLNYLMSLTESGALLWKELEKGAEVEDLKDILLKEYDVTLEEAEEDIQSFLKVLRDRELLQ